jgi:hypothetical protein
MVLRDPLVHAPDDLKSRVSSDDLVSVALDPDGLVHAHDQGVVALHHLV